MAANPNHYDMVEFQGKLIRRFNHHADESDVADMTMDEAIYILTKYAHTNGKEWSARPNLAQAARLAIQALNFMNVFSGMMEENRSENTAHIRGRD